MANQAQIEAAIKRAARDERRRQSKRAALIVLGLGAFAVAVLAIGTALTMQNQGGQTWSDVSGQPDPSRDLARRLGTN